MSDDLQDSKLQASRIEYDDETTLWESYPSQWLNFHYYLIYGCIWLITPAIYILAPEKVMQLLGSSLLIPLAGTLLISPPLIMLYHYFNLRCQVTKLTRNQIIETSGITVIFRRSKYCEVSDITDISTPPAGLLGLVNRATLTIKTIDETQPIIKFRGIKNIETLITIINPLRRKQRIDRRIYMNN